MSISARCRLLSIATALGLAACGGTTPAPAAPTPTPTPTGEGSAAAAVGTSGMPGLDWGAPVAAVTAQFPRGTVKPEGVEYLGTVLGHQAIAHFAIGARGLEKIDVEWTEGYISMAECGKGWAELRAAQDANLGASQAENLAAYWTTATADITLACNPNDSGAGVLSQTYVPHVAE